MSQVIRSARVIEVLTQLVSVHGAARFLRSDTGREFVARAIRRWLQTAVIETAFIDPGKPPAAFKAKHLLNNAPRCQNRRHFVDSKHGA